MVEHLSTCGSISSIVKALTTQFFLRVVLSPIWMQMQVQTPSSALLAAAWCLPRGERAGLFSLCSSLLCFPIAIALHDEWIYFSHRAGPGLPGPDKICGHTTESGFSHRKDHIPSK